MNAAERHWPALSCGFALGSTSLFARACTVASLAALTEVRDAGTPLAPNVTPHTAAAATSAAVAAAAAWAIIRQQHKLRQYSLALASPPPEGWPPNHPAQARPPTPALRRPTPSPRAATAPSFSLARLPSRALSRHPARLPHRTPSLTPPSARRRPTWSGCARRCANTPPQLTRVHASTVQLRGSACGKAVERWRATTTIQVYSRKIGRAHV